jgi:hypothetical protein
MIRFLVLCWFCLQSALASSIVARLDPSFARKGVLDLGACERWADGDIFRLTNHGFVVTQQTADNLTVRRFDSSGKLQKNFAKAGLFRLTQQIRSPQMRQFGQELLLFGEDLNSSSKQKRLVLDVTTARFLEELTVFEIPKYQDLEPKNWEWINPKALLVLYISPTKLFVIKYKYIAQNLLPDSSFGVNGVASLDFNNGSLKRKIASLEMNRQTNDQMSTNFVDWERFTFSAREDGHFVLAGRLDIDGRRGILLRYLPNGRLKSDFADQGILLGESPSDLGEYRAKLMPDGRMVVIDAMDDSPMGDELQYNAEFLNPQGKRQANLYLGYQESQNINFSFSSRAEAVIGIFDQLSLLTPKQKQPTPFRLPFRLDKISLLEFVGERMFWVFDCSNGRSLLRRVRF